jgi:hypothetical protein
MRNLSKDDTVTLLKKQNNFGNGALIRDVTGAKKIYLTTLDSQEIFFDLIWHYCKDSLVLTPGTWWGGGTLYTVEQVARRMVDQSITFADLVENKIPGTYKPDWFKSCLAIYENFDNKQFGHFVVKPAHHHQKRDCPTSLFCLIDGVHRSLVYAYLILTKKIIYQPIQTIIVIN